MNRLLPELQFASVRKSFIEPNEENALLAALALSQGRQGYTPPPPYFPQPASYQSPAQAPKQMQSGGFMGLLNSSLRNAGFNDDYIRASEAIMGGETGGDWTLTESDRYSPRRAREVFPDVFGNMSDAQISAMAGTPDFFETTYGMNTGRGRRLGNVNPGDGYRYRGRGPHQVTGRANYQRLADLTGHDIVNNPELLVTDPRVAADVTAAYMVDRVDQRGDPVADVRAAVSGSYTGRGFRMNIDADRRRYAGL